LPDAQVAEIRSRIESLHARQADYLKQVASGEIKPNKDLEAKWPQIQADALLMHQSVESLNGLDAGDPKRPALEATLLSQLQAIGIYLAPATHPAFTPTQLNPEQVAEMERIEAAIASLTYGDRKKAQPVKVLGSDPVFALVYLPVPIILKGLPNEKIYLAAMAGGRFANGLSLIELTADADGMAKTHWVSIGEAIGTCDISIYSQAAIERETMRIEVVSPNLNIFEGLPKPETIIGNVPQLKSAIGTATFDIRKAAN